MLITIKDGVRRMRFLCKSVDSMVMGGKRLYASELTDIIQAYEDAKNVFIRHFECRSAENGIRLSIELGRGVFHMEDFRKFMDAELTKKGFKLKDISILPGGYRDSLLRIKVDGKVAYQTKLNVFPKDDR